MTNHTTTPTKRPRVLLKLSGEQFAGEGGYGIDPSLVEKFAEEIKVAVAATNAEIVVVAGGGNIMRGATVKGSKIELVTGHYMGMLAGVLNGLAFADILNSSGVSTRLVSRLHIGTMVEPLVRETAVSHLEHGEVVLVVGGSGLPYVTHDTAAVTAALELGCSVVLKGTNVDGIYDKDPRKHPDAKRHDSIGHYHVLTDPNIEVMDNPAMSIAMENHLPIIVFDLLTSGNIRRVIQGEAIGTRVE
ncbi:MAG TPA: uridine monophosphate kinase [Candidatus Saccharimonadia bacterium]